MTPVTAEDYDGWLEHPVTQWVLAAMDARAEEQRAHWQLVSWEEGKAPEMLLVELRTRADTLKAMREASYFDMCNALQQDPVTDSR